MIAIAGDSCTFVGAGSFTAPATCAEVNIYPPSNDGDVLANAALGFLVAFLVTFVIVKLAARR